MNLSGYILAGFITIILNLLPHLLLGWLYYTFIHHSADWGDVNKSSLIVLIFWIAIITPIFFAIFTASMNRRTSKSLSLLGIFFTAISSISALLMLVVLVNLAGFRVKTDVVDRWQYMPLLAERSVKPAIEDAEYRVNLFHRESCIVH